ncbi:hypothetical protein SBRCBS47491_001454 [Sporothrix bragantina]|uniref:RING-type domain-containing protein n=1 Tax=Sporothrix bragantina TaxID=671064 RepID=A0ABP0AYR8_9PEZI
MASAFSAPRARLEPRDGYDVAYCHGCHHEWYLNEGAASPPPPCPRCHEDIVEIVEPENDPREYQMTTGNPLFSDLLMGITGLGHLAQRANQMHDDHLDGHDDPDDYDDGHHNHAQQSRRDVANPWHDPFSSNHSNHHQDDPQPEDEMDFSDPDVADIDEEEFQGPNNLYMFRSVANFNNQNQNGGSNPGTTGQGAAQPQQRSQPAPPPPSRAPVLDPSNPQAMMDTFMQFMQGLGSENRTGRSGPETLFTDSNPANPGNPVGPGNPGNDERGQANTPGGMPGVNTSQFNGRWRRTAFTTNYGTTSFTIATGPPHPDGAAAGGPGNFNTVFANIMGNVGPPNADGQNRQTPGANNTGNRNLPPFADALQHILSVLVNPNARVYNAGDVVHSDEGLDRIITMLMETNRPSDGAPPATEAALHELERKKVDAKMLEPDGHAECTICISEVALNDEVLYLPCKHWFHEECVVTWLRQHNTCPVCRTAVTSNTPGADNPTAAQAPGANPANPAGNTGAPDTNASQHANPAGQGVPRPGGPNVAERVRAGGTGNPAAGLFGYDAHMQAVEEQLRALHDRSINAANRRNQLNTDRLNAIRAAGNRPPEPSMPSTGSFGGSPYPPSTASASGAASPGPSSGTAATTTHNASLYRSSRVPEREAAADRERRRRDSHSPVPSPNITRSRFTIYGNNINNNNNPSPSPSERLREQRDQQRQRDREQRQMRDRESPGFENTWRWLGMTEPPNQPSQTPSASSTHSPQIQTQSGSGSRGPGHYFWYSTTQHSGPGDQGSNNNTNNMNGDGAANNGMPGMPGMFPNAAQGDPAGDGHGFATPGQFLPHALLLHQQLVNAATGGRVNVNFMGNAGGDPGSGGAHHGNQANNSSSNANANANAGDNSNTGNNGNSGNDNNNGGNGGGGGGFFSNIFRGFGGGGNNNSRRRS